MAADTPAYTAEQPSCTSVMQSGRDLRLGLNTEMASAQAPPERAGHPACAPPARGSGRGPSASSFPSPRPPSPGVLILLSVYIGGKVGAQVVGRLRDRLLSSIGKDLIVSPP
jgi:hypothetical protein